MDLSNPYQIVAEHFDGIVFLYEEEGDSLQYRFVEGEGLDEVGLTKEELEGHGVAEDRPPDVKEFLHAKYRTTLEGESVSFDIGAEGRHYQIQLRPVRDDAGTVIAGVGTAQDVTRQVLYRKELEQTNDRLERFTKLVFHDIRNPLAVAKGRLDLLKEAIESEHLDTISDALDRIESLTSREATLIEKREPESLEVLNLNNIVMASWQNVATKSADIEIETERTIRANQQDLRRLLENLFRNAVEHGGDDVTVTVGDLSAGFYVEDDGPGVPSEVKATAFERGVSGTNQGTGLGLFIVKNVADAHGWKLSLQESERSGARFEVSDVEFIS